MKKFFVTAVMAMSMGSVFAQGNATTNDTVKTDTTKALAAFMANDTVTTDSAKAQLAAMLACVAPNDTVTADSTKAAPAALVAQVENNDTVQSQNGKKEKETAPACDKKAGEKAIQALNAMRKITA